MKLAIITVIYNNYSDLDDYFASLQRQTDQDFVVLLSDLSPQKSQVTLPKYATILPFDHNGGYSYGLNQGLEKAIELGYDNFIFMNNDVTVDKNFIRQAKKSLQTYPASMIGGKIYYYPGFEYHKDRYVKSDEGKVLWFAGGEIKWAHATADHRGVNDVDAGQYDQESPTDFVTGCLMIFDKALIDKVGMMDDSYFLYYEDVDWCVRTKRLGCHLWYVPSIMIWHKVSQSTGGSGSRLHQHYQTKNQLKFALKYAPLRTKLHVVKNFILKKLSLQ